MCSTLLTQLTDVWMPSILFFILRGLRFITACVGHSASCLSSVPLAVLRSLFGNGLLVNHYLTCPLYTGATDLLTKWTVFNMSLCYRSLLLCHVSITFAMLSSCRCKLFVVLYRVHFMRKDQSWLSVSFWVGKKCIRETINGKEFNEKLIFEGKFKKVSDLTVYSINAVLFTGDYWK